MEIPSDVASVIARIGEIAAGPRLEGAGFAAEVNAARAVSRSEIERYVDAAASANRVDPALVEAIIGAESGFDPTATSRAGARGLMQLMPQTAAELGVADLGDPAANVRAGTRYLRSLLDRFGDVTLAVAAYNAGPGAVERFGAVPPYAETRHYVRDVMARYRELRARRAAVLKPVTPR
jgi:soluble lytic murein transglycosylase-like protein